VALVVGVQECGGLGFAPAAGAEPQSTSDLETLELFRDALKDDRLAKPKRIFRVARSLTPGSERLDVPAVLDKPSAEELLSPHVHFAPVGTDDGPKGRTEVLAWLDDPEHRSPLASAPHETLSAGRGRYVAIQVTTAQTDRSVPTTGWCATARSSIGSTTLIPIKRE
jgi:hypothetical protein